MTSTMTQHVELSEGCTRAYVESWLRVKDTLGTARAWAQHVELSEGFTEAHVESWLRIFGFAGHCACVGSTR